MHGVRLAVLGRIACCLALCSLGIPACVKTPHLVHDIRAKNDDGTVNAVIEIPTGTNAKYMIDHETGQLIWEQRNGRPRVVDYLGYPGNYGIVPSTMWSRDRGGDGDPLDVLVLGTPVARGAVLRVRLVGALRLTDAGAQDDKWIAVRAEPDYRGPFRDVRDLAELDGRYPGVREILERWFSSYDAEDETSIEGWIDAAEAQHLLDQTLVHGSGSERHAF